MKRKGLVSAFIAAVMLASVLSVLPLGATSTTTLRTYFPDVGAYDELIATTPGEVGDLDTSFTVHIIVEDVQALACWAFAVSWDPAILECVDDGYGTTSALDGDPWYLIMPYTVNNTAGTIAIPGAVAPDPLVGVDGAFYPDCPLLFWAEFMVIGYGSTPLTFYIVSLLDPTITEIFPRVVIDGFFDNTALKPGIDTVLDFWFIPNSVGPGETVELYGTLMDEYGSPVYLAQVGVEYSTDGGATWHYIWTLWTNAAGEFSRTFSAPGVGEYLVRVSYGGSAVYNPSSDTETLIVEIVWGDYHFQIDPFIDVLHLKIDGSVIYGIDDAAGFYSDQPVLGYIEGGTFYLFIDFTKDDFGDPIYYELVMLVGSTSTLSGNMYRTTDGTGWVGPTAFSLVSASSSSDSSATGQALASPSVEPQGWPATYHFRLSPWIDVVHLHIDGPILHGLDDAAGFYSDQPVLGYVSGNFFIFAIDWTKDDFGDPIYYELGMIVGSVSTLSGNAHRTTDGKSWDFGPAITLVPA